jgi:hypothetical protein
MKNPADENAVSVPLIEDNVLADLEAAYTGANPIAGPAQPRRVSQQLEAPCQLLNVALGLLFAPGVDGVVEDFRQVGVAFWSEPGYLPSRILRAARNCVRERSMTQVQRQNLTVSLSVQTIRKAKVLAAKRSTSISGLVAEQIEALVNDDDAYEKAHKEALALMKRGFHLGGEHRISRDELHER